MSLSVTEIGTLVRDPYAVYARHVLELDPLEMVAVEPSAALKGNIVHEVMNVFVQAFPAELPPDTRRRADRHRRQGVRTATPEGLRDHQDVYAAWWARFRFGWPAGFNGEPGRRVGSPHLKAEMSRLAPRVARERRQRSRCVAGRTGSSSPGRRSPWSTSRPGRAEHQGGEGRLQPAADARGRHGQAGRVRECRPADARRTRLREAVGRREPARRAGADGEGPRRRGRAGAASTSPNSRRWCANIAPGGAVSRPYAKFAKRYADYDHLARVREWSLAGADDAEDGDERGPRRPGDPAVAEQGLGSARSAWVSANAGAGKTRCWRTASCGCCWTGCRPAASCALTFTKAAAANMATRVFELARRVGDDGRCEAVRAIAKIEGRAPARRLARARRLFARAVETPGGLKIQTIHAFCERLLHLFPFEANVAARFEVLDDATGAEMQAAPRSTFCAAALHPKACGSPTRSPSSASRGGATGER